MRTAWPIWLVLLLLLFTGAVAAEQSEGERRYGIHVVNMGAGDDLFSRFGHIALMVSDRQGRVDKVYNFGTFDFSDPDLQLRYARGYLDYWLSVDSWPSLLRRYQYYDRDVWLRTLDLDREQALEVKRRLEENARPENRVYAYRHYLDNCCTRIRDLLDDVLDGAISSGRDQEPTDRTFRSWTRRALAGLPVMQSIILFSLGPAIDRPITRWDEQFLPEVLVEDLDRVHNPRTGRPLVSRNRHLVQRQGPPVGNDPPGWEIATIAVAAGLLLLGLALPAVLGARSKAPLRLAGIGLIAWGLLAGLGGLMLVLYWTVTTHTDTWYNENLLVWPVTHLWLLGPGFKLVVRARLGERAARLVGQYL
ncbi:MAG TPA: DUF4105 domain-containing protein, partial [Polyangia bacterium]|nr:DUF4105 domain-containing protein [Polyangia bacterium]